MPQIDLGDDDMARPRGRMASGGGQGAKNENEKR